MSSVGSFGFLRSLSSRLLYVVYGVCPKRDIGIVRTSLFRPLTHYDYDHPTARTIQRF